MLWALGGLIAAAPSLLVFLVIHQEYIDGRVRVYKHFYAELQVGMSRAEVEKIVQQCYPPSGDYPPPKRIPDEPGKLGFWMDPSPGREPNCEAIILTMTNDRVTKKQYVRD